MVESHADRDVDLVPLEGLDGIGGREVQDVVGHPRRRRLSGHQRRQDQEGKDVGHPDREGSLGVLRGEAGVAFEHALNLPQQLPKGLRELDRPGRCLHAGRRADKEFVAEHPAQPAKSVAHGGLAQTHALGGPRDVPFRQQRLQGDQ